MTIHRYPWDEEAPSLHKENMDCPCGTFVDFEIEGPNRQVSWVIRHTRFSKRVA